MNSPSAPGRRAVIAGLILLGVLSRLVPHPWNATPVTGIALLAGAYLTGLSSFLLPLSILAISDLLLGWHATLPFTWGACLAISLLGRWVGQYATGSRIVVSSLLGSALFFLVTNFGVWLVGDIYPLTPAGLWQCYIASLPFLRATVFGDLVYTVVLFGIFALAAKPLEARITVHTQ